MPKEDGEQQPQGKRQKQTFAQVLERVVVDGLKELGLPEILGRKNLREEERGKISTAIHRTCLVYLTQKYQKDLGAVATEFPIDQEKKGTPEFAEQLQKRSDAIVTLREGYTSGHEFENIGGTSID